MRFIFNFILFGILFYLIYLAFPETFYTLVSWVDKLTGLIKELYFQLVDKFQEWMQKPSAPKALFRLLQS